MYKLTIFPRKANCGMHHLLLYEFHYLTGSCKDRKIEIMDVDLKCKCEPKCNNHWNCRKNLYSKKWNIEIISNMTRDRNNKNVV
jgi:hypothetical protein